jgi:hypothetical protein
MDNSDLAVKGAASARINKEEVKRLILEADSAWRKQTELGLCDSSFEDWRHAALWDAVRKSSFRNLGQREFGIALGYFRKLSGKPEARQGWNGTSAKIAERESGPEGDRRRAEYKLREACRTHADAFNGDPEQALAYALVLLRQIHCADLPTATAKQIWQVMFTLNTRAAKRIKREETLNAQRSTLNAQGGAL